MTSKLKGASIIAAAATMIAALASAQGSGAAAQELLPVAVQADPVLQFISAPVVQPLSQSAPVAAADATPELLHARVAQLLAQEGGAA